MHGPTDPIVLTVLPQGSRLLDILVDLGHLNEALLIEINQKLLKTHAIDNCIDLSSVKRIVAESLFDNMKTLPMATQKALIEDWKYLFA